MNLPFLSNLNDLLLILSSIAGALLVILPAGRKAIRLSYRWLCSLSRGHRNQERILEGFESIKELLAANGERLSTIETEMKFNGGKTIKDMLFLLFNYRRHDYWRIPHPVMEIDGEARVTLVSEVTCRLFGVVNPDDLKSRSWLTYVADTNVEKLLRSYLEAVSFQSEFNWPIHLRSATGVVRGEWELRASPISQPTAVNKIYSAALVPMDDAAKRVARELQVQGLVACALCQVEGAMPIPADGPK